MTHLRFFAGPAALQHVRDHGLSAVHVRSVFGASGAAKWLTIYGLDRAIFTRFLADTGQPIHLFGTSIGAFKLAAAAQPDPGAALTRLANAYIEQSYQGEVTPTAVAAESQRITQHMLGADGVRSILASERYRFHCGTVRCRGFLGSGNLTLQRLGMLKAFSLAALGRRHLGRVAHRAVFSDPRALTTFGGADDYPTEVHPLDANNFKRALLASGSIPIVMQGVVGLPGEGAYRDGGLLDYHPVPSNLQTTMPGLVLYPHFYPHLIEGWFDKFLGSRSVPGSRLDNVLLVAPSDDYVAELPGGQIPDRKDFHTFAADDAERKRRWSVAMTRSNELGEEFIDLVQSGEIASVVQPMPQV